MRKTSAVVLMALLTVLSVQAFAYAYDPPLDFLLKWGTIGSGDGQFHSPSGVAVDMQGNVYVADTDNHRIQKFDGDGNFLLKWGDKCVVLGPGEGCVDPDGEGPLELGDGQFYSPSGVAVDMQGNVYVADSRNNRVQVFDASGAFLTKWGKGCSSLPCGDGQFFNPLSVAVDLLGNVYVAESEYWLMDWGNRIQKFDGDGNFLLKWGDTCNMRYGYFCVDPDGEGPLELGDGQFHSPSGVAVDMQGNVYVAEFGNERIQKFDSDGNFLLKWSHYLDDWPWGVAVSATGNVYVVHLYGRILIFDGDNPRPLGNVGFGVCRMDTPEWCIDPDGEGPLELGDGSFWLPHDVAVDVRGNVYVADTSNHRIQVFGPVTTVGIEIKPGSYPNCFNVSGSGVLPVAILGSDSLDVTEIDVPSLTFAGLDVRVKGNGTPQCAVEDVSGDFTFPEGAPDGFPDLVCQFVDDTDTWNPGDDTATLTGRLNDGTHIKGADEICIVP